MIWREIRSVLSHRWTLICMGLCLLLFLGSNWDYFTSTSEYSINGTAVSLVQTPLALFNHISASKIKYYLPMLCCLPAVFIACEEWNSGFYRLQFTRMPWQAFALRRIVANAIAGSLVLFIPVLIMTALCFLRAPYENPYFPLASPLAQVADYSIFPYEFGGRALTEQVFPAVFEKLQFAPLTAQELWELLSVVPAQEYALAELRMIGVQLLGYGVFGMLWAMVGLAVSSWIPNRYITLALPFAISFFLVGLLPEAITPLFRPYSIFNAFDEINYSYGVFYLVAACEFVFAAILYVTGMGRRLIHG